MYIEQRVTVSLAKPRILSLYGRRQFGSVPKVSKGQIEEIAVVPVSQVRCECPNKIEAGGLELGMDII